MNDKLLKLTLTVRFEIEEIIKHEGYNISTEWPESRPFPYGCCKLSSLILGLFMKNDFKLIGVEFISGYRKDYGYHGWIEYGSNIYDITIDQFEKEFKTHPKFVINKSLSDFHNSFNIQKRFDVVLSESNVGYKVYETIKEKVLSKMK